MTDAEDFTAGRSGSAPLFDPPADEQEGPFARSKTPPSSIERIVADVIWRHRGRKNAITRAMLSKMFGRSERQIKDTVRELVVTHHMRIGGFRGGRDGLVGYAVIVDAEDLAQAVGPLQSEVVEIWRRLRVLMDPHQVRALHGQLELDGR